MCLVPRVPSNKTNETFRTNEKGLKSIFTLYRFRGNAHSIYACEKTQIRREIIRVDGCDERIIYYRNQQAKMLSFAFFTLCTVQRKCFENFRRDIQGPPPLRAFFPSVCFQVCYKYPSPNEPSLQLSFFSIWRLGKPRGVGWPVCLDNGVIASFA